MSEAQEDTRLDYPNRQVLGLDPPWVEGASGEEAPEAETQSADSPDLDEMNKAELLAYAQDIGVKPANNDMTKDELRDGIDAKLAEGD